MIDAGFYSENDRYDVDRDYADYSTGKVYFAHHIQSGMTKDELAAVYEELVARLLYGVRSGPSTTCVHDFTDLQAAFFEAVEAAGIEESEILNAVELTAKVELEKMKK